VGKHKAAVVFRPGGHAIQPLRVEGAPDIFGREPHVNERVPRNDVGANGGKCARMFQPQSLMRRAILFL
jgi:hypothetical protein